MRGLSVRNLATVAAIAVGAVVVASCATMSQKDCLGSDWQAVGDRDGGRGASPLKIDAYTKVCAKAGVTPDAALYAKGREQGLVRYCTEDNGFYEGRSGRSYGQVCPPPAQSAFLGGYADGERVYRATQRLESARSDLSLADSRADKRARQADGVEDELRNPKLTDEQTRELRDRLQRLRRERREAIEDGRRTAAAIRDAEREVDDLKAMLSPRYGRWL